MLCAALFCQKPEPEPLPHGISLPLYRQRHGIYLQFCSTLGIEPKGGKPGMFRAIQEQVLYLYREKKQPLLLAIDEAQYLSTGILENIKMLIHTHL